MFCDIKDARQATGFELPAADVEPVYSIRHYPELVEPPLTAAYPDLWAVGIIILEIALGDLCVNSSLTVGKLRWLLCEGEVEFPEELRKVLVTLLFKGGAYSLEMLIHFVSSVEEHRLEEKCYKLREEYAELLTKERRCHTPSSPSSLP